MNNPLLEGAIFIFLTMITWFLIYGQNKRRELKECPSTSCQAPSIHDGTLTPDSHAAIHDLSKSQLENLTMDQQLVLGDFLRSVPHAQILQGLWHGDSVAKYVLRCGGGVCVCACVRLWVFVCL